MELIKDSKIDFVSKMKYAFIFSGILTLLGIIALIQIARGSANMGIDFAGGTNIQLKFEKPVAIDTARKLLEHNGYKDSELQQFSDPLKMLIKVKKSNVELGRIADTITDLFAKNITDNKFIVESTTEIGPTVGNRLQKDALIAVFISLLGIIVYIAWRFEFRFGIAASIATFHDVLAVLGLFFLLNKEINLLLITALLTLAGYSLTDTVVVFDRIRENLHKKLKQKLEELINISVNEVLSRTIVTSSTVFLVCFALFFLGGDVIHDFSFALLAGVVVGTYSSIFVASPILIVWQRTFKTKRVKK